MSIFDKSSQQHTSTEIQCYARVESKKYKGVFIHVPKTAGTTMNVVFSSDNDVIVPNTPFLTDIMNNMNTRPLFTFQVSYVDYLKEIFGEERYNSLFKFAFVRNPWDRYVSNWKYLTRLRKRPISNNTDPWANRGFSGSAGNVTFAEFVEQIDRIFDPDEKDLHSFRSGQWHHPGWNYDMWHMADQSKFLLDSSGTMAVDFVGRYENLEKDYEYVCKQLGISPIDLPVLKKSQDPNVHYSSHYTPELYEIIKKRCKADIDYFKYKFDDQAGILPKKKK